MTKLGIHAEPWPLYHYRGRTERVIDGDTIRVTLDLGLRVYRSINLRIADVDTPEVYGSRASEEGRTARDALAAYLGERTLYIETRKDALSFDRYVGDVYVVEDGAMVNVADWLVLNSYAVRV